MKKTILSSILALAISTTNYAQSFLNADFSQTSASSTEAGSFTNWIGTALASNIINGGGNYGAMLNSSISTSRVRVCSQYGIDKATGREICLQYGFENVYEPQFYTLSQSLAITEIPQKISGKFKYSSNVTNLNSAMIIEGNYGGNRFQDTLIIDNTTQGIVQELKIGTNYLPCIVSNGFKPVDNCTVKNRLEIKLVSCLNCPTEANLSSTNSLSVDDLEIINSVVSSLFETSSNSQLNIYPNPATDFITVFEFSEIFDLVGNKVAEGTDRIDVSSLTNGVYLVKTAKDFGKIVVE